VYAHSKDIGKLNNFLEQENQRAKKALPTFGFVLGL
jgi:hypothetical protein